MSALIYFLLMMITASAIIILISAYQATIDYLDNRSEYKEQIKELQDTIEEQENLNLKKNRQELWQWVRK